MTLDVVLYQKPISPSLLSLTANRPRWKKNSTKKQNQNDYFIDEMNTINCLCFIRTYMFMYYTYLYAPCFKLLSAMFLSVCLLCMFISV